MADTIVSAADEVVEELGDLITPSTQGNDLTEAAWQRKLRYQATERRNVEGEYKHSSITKKCRIKNISSKTLVIR